MQEEHSDEPKMMKTKRMNSTSLGAPLREDEARELKTQAENCETRVRSDLLYYGRTWTISETMANDRPSGEGRTSS